MNNVSPVADPKKGILLNDTVDLGWLISVNPRFYDEYINLL